LHSNRSNRPDYSRRGNACSAKGLNDRRMRKMANLAGRRRRVVIVVVPEANRGGEQEQ
jgi:hypothetical protein